MSLSLTHSISEKELAYALVGLTESETDYFADMLLDEMCNQDPDAAERLVKFMVESAEARGLEVRLAKEDRT